MSAQPGQRLHDSPEQLTPSQKGGLMSNLHHILPRYALFHACIQIHQISNIPLVSGEFAARWKVKNSTSRAPGSRKRLLGRLSSKRKGKEKDGDATDSGAETPSRKNTSNIASLASRIRSTSANSVASSTSTSTPSRSNTFFSSQSSIGTHSRSSSTSSHSSLLTSAFPCTCPNPPFENSPHRGMTEFLPLKDHAVNWKQTLHHTLKMPISRGEENGLLLPSPCKLAVLQRVIPGDPNAPQKPRLGAVYLDLAEYAGVKGETTRRYLLRESKTNATLKLTITMKQVGGESNFTAPVLPKGEILNGITGLLDNEVYKTRPRALDLFGPYQDFTEGGVPFHPLPDMSSKNLLISSRGVSDTETSGSDDEGEDLYDNPLISPPKFSRQRSSSYTRKRPPAPLQARSFLSPILPSPDPSPAGPKTSHTPTNNVPFDIAHLPFAYGPKTTETLIEALFNPVPISEMPGFSEDSGLLAARNNPFVQYSGDTPKTAGADQKGKRRDDFDMERTIGRSNGLVSLPKSAPAVHRVEKFEPGDVIPPVPPLPASVSQATTLKPRPKSRKGTGSDAMSVHSVSTTTSHSSSASTNHSGSSGQNTMATSVSLPPSRPESRAGVPKDSAVQLILDGGDLNEGNDTPNKSRRPTWLKKRSTMVTVASSNPSRPSSRAGPVVGIVLS